MATLSATVAAEAATCRTRLRRSTILGWGLVAAAAYLVMVTWMFWSPDFSLHQFKGYFANDQESYLAIAVNMAHGDYRSVEPFTQTGSIYYPRLYYQGLGMLANVTHSDPVVLWWLGSLGSQALLAGSVGSACVTLTRRRWTAVLGPLALTAGIFGEIRGTGWLTPLQEHAVLWGSFAELFAGNGATVASVVATLCLLALVGVVSGRIAGRRAVALGLVVAVLLGAIASVHTYTFLTSTYVVTYVVACSGLLRRGGRTAVVSAVTSLVLLVALILLGPQLDDHVGPLALLVAGLLPAAPGLLLAVTQDRRILAGFVLLALGAAPQVVLTAHGVAAGDPFLTFRQDSSRSIDLGVPAGTGLFHGTLLLAALAMVLAAGLAAGRTWWTSIAVGSAVAWILLWNNDSWGANQEPYRLWLNGFAMLLPVVIVVLAWVYAELGTRWVRVAGAGLLVLLVLSMTDYLAFSLSPAVDDTIAYDTPQLDAVAEVVGDVPRDDGTSLVLAGPCIEPRGLKVRTGLPVAYENVGMAWATRHDALVALVPDMWAGHSPPADAPFDPRAARGAGVRYVLTDTACDHVYRDPSLRLVRSAPYRTPDDPAAEIQLWTLD